MKKILLLILSSIFWIACDSHITPSDLEKLNGYWEIEYVLFPNATQKKYTLNNQVDFIYVNEGKGYLKKVQPTVEGRFQTSNVAMPFKIVASDQGFQMVYENEIMEFIDQVNNDILVLKTEDNTFFHYKRFEPLKPFSNE